MRILGEYDSPTLSKIDNLLGGVILGSGLAMIVTPVAGLVAAWSWVGQKNEAVRLMNKLLHGAIRGLGERTQFERHQLIGAAHTVLAAAAFLEVVRSSVGEENYRAVQLSDREEERVALGRWRMTGEPFLEFLYSHPIPAPSATIGFYENCAAILDWHNDAAARLRDLMDSYVESSDTSPEWLALDPKALAKQASSRYRTLYLKMCADVPEFFIWASLSEHRATRKHIEKMGQDFIRAVSTREDAALARMTLMLQAVAGAEHSYGSEKRLVMSRANRAVLSEPIVPIGSQLAEERVNFPTVEKGFVSPSYRFSRYTGGQSRPWDDRWWTKQAVHNDLDVKMCSFLTAPEGVMQPCLVLGHPGAGKSMLTRVLAAKLPYESYTCLHVPLRRVSSDALIYNQIEEGLQLVTHGRTNWSELTDHSRDTVRVIFLDGLDEMLQASRIQRTAYLQDVAEFQRREFAQERPVYVVVTSRTVVADRVAIPEGTLVIRLEEFHEAQVESWLSKWREANRQLIDAGSIRGLDSRTAMRHRDLATQPLLLMMLALYSADPQAADLNSDISSATLYRQLLHQFAFREASKRTAEPEPEPMPIDDRINKHLWRLSVAAFAMFNRGSQQVRDDALGSDLSVLAPSKNASEVRVTELGSKTISEFFFVHAAESDGMRPNETRRAYEFLHATFGEYLIASAIIDEVAKLAGIARLRRGLGNMDDELLFALLSHQPLANRSSILTFCTQLIEGYHSTLDEMSLALSSLFINARSRPDSSHYRAYRPSPTDHVRQIAAYTANLLLLKLICAKQPVPIADIYRSEDAEAQWRSSVEVWQASLTPEGCLAIARSIRFDGTSIALATDASTEDDLDISFARLSGNLFKEIRLRLGTSLLTEKRWHARLNENAEEIVSLLLTLCIEHESAEKRKAKNSDQAWAAELLNIALVGKSLDMTAYETVHETVRVALNTGRSPINSTTLIVLKSRFPELVRDFPKLRSIEGTPYAVVADQPTSQHNPIGT
ncbi:NACHT domain-containing NTPase [Micromonospora sp. RP3T]|uniref:NACHT domain-containing protein n=1 Tax=Micromonospora sp. RP3T TaxID=2135446 RepID=UPI001304D8C3|nr:AAA family ATPase [Micromonospora sp. RP3T]